MKRYTQLPEKSIVTDTPISPQPRWQWLHSAYLHIVRMKGKPEYLARGLAAGVFAGFFPFFGLQTILGIAIAILIRGKKLLAVAGTWVSNPLTYIPMFLFNYKVGRWLLGTEHPSISKDSLLAWESIVDLGAEVAITLLVGCFVMGIMGAIASYFIGIWLIRRWRRRQVQRYWQVKAISSED